VVTACQPGQQQLYTGLSMTSHVAQHTWAASAALAVHKLPVPHWQCTTLMYHCSTAQHGAVQRSTA
jgi:hypothetical protein